MPLHKVPLITKGFKARYLTKDELPETLPDHMTIPYIFGKPIDGKRDIKPTLVYV